jgi:Carboxypeptidase regulatory-like domain
MRCVHVRALWCFVVLFLGVSSALAQISSTSLQGTVTDPSGSAIAGATVFLSNPESRTERNTVTDATGEYRFLSLPPGTYTLSVIARGFAGNKQTDLQLLVNTPATANVQLKVGSATETVTVQSEAPALNLVDASIGDSFGETQVRQIPLEGRNVPDLLSLQAGVAYTGNRPDLDKDQDTRNGAVNGARSDQSNISLDGVDVNDQSSGYAFTSVLPVTLDSVQEFRVTTANYNADQGQGSGAQVALVTKSGTNSIHGSIYEYHRNTLTSANDYFIKQSQLAANEPNKPLKLIRNIFGGSVGGPLKRERSFFFFNYEGTRRREDLPAVRSIPTASMCQGIIQYIDTSGGVTTLRPSDIKVLDPLHIGINPAILDPVGHTGYFDKTFCNGKYPTNDTSVGDGLNYAGFRFKAPVSDDENALIARIDHRLDPAGKHSIFWRGAMRNVNNPGEPFLPGTPPMETLGDHSKGMAVGYTAVISPTIVNSFHWGFTRQSAGIVGNTNQAWNTFNGLDQGFAYSHNLQMPVHNFLDDLSWNKGKHTLQFGANLGTARNPRVSYLHSFNQAVGTTSWMSPTGFASTGGQLDPANGGFLEPASTIAYDYPMLAMLGMVSQMIGNYNYDRNGNLLAEGDPVKRRYGLNWYEFYGQDSWRVKPNLTVTYGLRWSLFPPPWEVNGWQAASSVNLGQQFNQTALAMQQGLGYANVAPLTFVLSGKANNGAGFYGFEKTDFAPRISIAYSPRPEGSWLRKIVGDADKTVIRAGFGKVYDRAGMQLISTFDANAPAGLSATVQNPCCIPGVDDAGHVPRITDINQIPATNSFGVQFLEPAPSGAFPQTPNPAGQAITWGTDANIKTPNAYALDFSIGRELPNRFSLQASYVGRLGRRLLTQRDLRQPLDLTDPKTHIDYFAAATRLSQLARQGVSPSDATYNWNAEPTAAYWQDVTQPLTSGQYQIFGYGPTSSLMQAVYQVYSISSYAGNEVVGLGNVDLLGYLTDTLGNSHYFCATPACTSGVPGNLLNNQAAALFGWSSIASSSYHGLQLSLRKQTSHGVQFDFNYTFSKSIDITSAASRVGFNGGILGSQLSNAFDLRQHRGVSDFDTTHQINANWIAELPFGRGKAIAADASTLLDSLVGGWQVSGLLRWTSGFPFSVGNGYAWATDWNYSGLAQMVTKPKTGVYVQPDGSVSVFANPAAAQADFTNPFPGQSGSRNVLRGPGFVGVDMGLSKRWKLPFENSSLQFRWEVFNVFNQVRFNVQSVTNPPSFQQVPSAFGNFTSLLTNPRVMQFALRYEF